MLAGLETAFFYSLVILKDSRNGMLIYLFILVISSSKLVPGALFFVAQGLLCDF